MEVPNRERAVDEMNVFEPCPFSKFVEGNEPGDGGVTPRCAFVGGVLLEVDGHVMGGLGPTTTKPWSGYREFFQFGNGVVLTKDGASFVGGRHMSQDTNWKLRANMLRH